MTSSNGNIFRVSGHLCGEFTGEFPHKGQWRGALMFSLICVWINGWVNNREAGHLRRHCAHCDIIVMQIHLIHFCAFNYIKHTSSSSVKAPPITEVLRDSKVWQPPSCIIYNSGGGNGKWALWQLLNFSWMSLWKHYFRDNFRPLYIPSSL